MNNNWSRRKLLRGLGTIGSLATVSGCSALSGESGISVSGLGIISHLSTETVIDVTVERDGKLVFDEAVTLAADDHVVRKATWSTEPASYRVLAAAFGSEAEHEVYEVTVDTPGGSPDADCYVLTLRFGGPGGPYSIAGERASRWDLECD